MKARYWVLIGIATFLAALGAVFGWLLTTASGARNAAAIATRLMDGKLSIRAVSGTLAGPLHLTGIHYRDRNSGVDASIDAMTVDVALWELLSRRAHVRLVSLSGVHVALGEPLRKVEKEQQSFSLEPPLDIVLNSFVLDKAVVERSGKPVVEIVHAQVAGAWTGAGIAIEKLIVDATQGHVALKGRVSEGRGYAGNISGSFDWTVSGQPIAGTLDARSNARELRADIGLSSPARAQIVASIGQNKALPWRAHIDVPAFDPRRSLLKDSSLTELGAKLDAHGDLTSAELRGDVNVNSEHALIDPLRVEWSDPVLTISALNLRRAGTSGELQVNGTVSFEQKPFVADVKARWTTIELPARWVGQALLTQGDVTAHGNMSTFAVKGALQLGPRGRLADLAVDVTGTPEQIDIRQASIVQKEGHLAVRGSLKLRPAVAWQLQAEARTFDPGAFVAGWPGKLGFKLETEGAMADKTPLGTLMLRDLRGSLRRRSIAGRADLAFERGGVLAGNVDLRSGQSSIHFAGEHGQVLNATARLDIASLDDWLPASRGRIGGTVRVSGTWPAVDVEAHLNAEHLYYSNIGVGKATLSATVNDPKHPSGTARAQLSDITAADFRFAQIGLDADGSRDTHSVHLKADGDPLSAELRLQGAQSAQGWSGTVTELSLKQKNVASLALQQPIQLRFAEPEFSISTSCMAGDGISVCFGAERDSRREIKANYKIEHLPLSLLVSLAAPTLPYKISGTLEGYGEARRAPDGALFGTAAITAEAGEIREAGAQAPSLLQYRQFQLNAQLAGDTAEGSTRAQLGADGKLEGRINLAGLRSAAPTIDTSVRLAISDLSPVSLFVPQIANVHGSAEAAVDVTGTLHAPQITGRGRLAGLSAEIPRIGLKLHDGEFSGSLAARNAIEVNGHIASGAGSLTVTGTTGTSESLRLKISGKNFLAADIPGARLVIAPDLDFTRGADRMDLSGSVTIPEAAVDLTKLPQGQQQRAASPDVIVVDDETAGEARSTPLYANVKIILGEGEKVKLVGFGLAATLAGQLSVQEAPGQDTTGAGEIRVAGTYKAYGQDLTIREGRLLYANQPLTNPQIILTAVRVVGATTAKLTVTGTALRPQLDVSADPAMSQTQALSLLVTGKPVEQLGSGEGDAVQTAARSVGGAAGNLLAKNIGKRLGIDTIGVDQSSEIGGSAFTIGQYLSPKLYVSYGVGLFESGQVITLRYKLSDRVSLEAAQGPLNQRAGITYKVER